GAEWRNSKRRPTEKEVHRQLLPGWPSNARSGSLSELIAFILLARHFPDFAHGSPIAIRHRHTKQFLSACREPGSAHALGCMQIEDTLTQMKPFACLSKAV